MGGRATRRWADGILLARADGEQQEALLGRQFAGAWRRMLHDVIIVSMWSAHQRVQMDVEIERPTEALDDHDGATAPIGDALTARAAPEEPKHRADGHAADGAAQVMIPRQQAQRFARGY